MRKLVINILFCIIIAGLVGLYIFSKIDNSLHADGWVSRISGLLEEIMGSIIFLVIVLVMIKPSIKIATTIARIPASNHEPEHLRLKFVNCSIFKAYDLHVDIYEMKRISLSGDDVKPLRLGSYDGFETGPAYLQSALKAINDNVKRNAAQIRVRSLVKNEEDFIKALDSNDSFIEIHVSVRHGLSGLQEHYIRRFHNPGCIKPGYYGHGFDTKVKS